MAARRKSGFNFARLLFGVALVLLIASTVYAVAIYAGLIPGPGQVDGRLTEPQPQAAMGGATSPGSPERPGTPQQVAQATQGVETRHQDVGDWVYSCVVTAAGNVERCAIGQEILQSETKAFVFLSRFVKADDGSFVGIWQTPDTVLLTRGISLEIGAPKPVVIPYETCGGGRCQATANLDAGFVNLLGNAQELSATIVSRNKRAVKLVLSVNGLSDALALLGAGEAPGSTAN